MVTGAFAGAVPVYRKPQFYQEKSGIHILHPQASVSAEASTEASVEALVETSVEAFAQSWTEAWASASYVLPAAPTDVLPSKQTFRHL